MTLETKQIEGALRNCRVLIVEDDIHLAKNIAAIFKEHTGLEPEVAHCEEEARDIVANGQNIFCLAIIDVMLPKTRLALAEIAKHEKTLESIRETIEKAGTHPHNEATKLALSDARWKRSQALEQINALIDREGGIELVKEWRKESSRQNDFFPILYLTAIGNDAAIQRGRLAAGECSEWIVKPVPSNVILEKCVNLLLKRHTQSGDDRL
jgi:DNA-binding response OmpR family regulator